MDYILKIIYWFYVLSAIEAATLGASCNNTVPCTPTIETCTSNVCECGIEYFNVNGECESKIRLAPTITNITSTTSTISVYWSHPNTYYDLLSNYEVTWKANGSSGGSSGLLEKTVKLYTVSSHLMSGQLYVVNVISYVYRTNPTKSIAVNSTDATVRLVPKHPGSLLTRECDFTHDNLLLKWTPPSETFVTRYELQIEGIAYTTTNFFPMIQFNGKIFLPGWRYYVRYFTVSGTTHVKKSRQFSAWIKTIPTRPGPPTNVRCVANPIDVSLEISWTPPTNPNGVIVQYQINVNLGKMNQVNISSSSTKKVIENLIPDFTYSFTVRTINDAAESIRISDPSPAIFCTAIVITTSTGQSGATIIPTTELENTVEPQTTPIIMEPTSQIENNDTGLAPIITKITSTITTISIYWNHPSTYDILSNYEVIWKMNGSSATESSGLLDKTMKQYTVSSYLMAGQLYIVNVISHAYVSNYSASNLVPSIDATVRLVPVHPGTLLTRECDFTHDNLLLRWTPPFETFVTKYELKVEGITYTTTNFFPMIQFKGKVFLPGWRYYVRYFTVSGTTHVKKSRQFSAWIKTNPTRPGPPTNIRCVANPVDVSIEISWTPPTNPNGIIVQYQINVNPGKMNQVNISSSSTKKVIEHLIPEGTYIFAVRTINDASESIRVSYPSHEVSCTITEKVETANTSQTTSTIVAPTSHVDSNETGLAPIITNLTSTTSLISVFWNHPSTHFELVYKYEVTWKMTGSSAVESSGLLEKTVKQYTVSSYLMAGQLYIVNVISHVKLTNISASIAEHSNDATVRLVPVHPGTLLTRECNFAHDNLLLKWTPPSETFVTKYEIRIEGITYTTTNFFPMLQFNGKVFLPGWRYYVRYLTVSGTTHVKKSRQFSAWIRTIPTKPGSPTKINCIVNQVDVSIEISWTAPTNPNGVIIKYQININPGKWDQKNISSDSTKKVIKNLLPEQTYTFTVRTVNDAVESIRVSGPSQAVSCQIKPKVTDSTALPPVTETSSKTNTVSKTTLLPPVTPTPEIKDIMSKTTSLPRITSTPHTVSKATSMPPVTSTPHIKDTENCICKSSGSTIPTSQTTVLLFALIWIPAWIIQKIISDTE